MNILAYSFVHDTDISFSSHDACTVIPVSLAHTISQCLMYGVFSLKCLQIECKGVATHVLLAY